MKINGEGSIPSRIMIVTDAPTDSDQYSGFVFSGAAGQELNRLLQSASIMRSDCYTTAVCRSVPPGGQLSNLIARTKKDITLEHVRLNDKYVLPSVIEGYLELLKEIELVKPNVIVVMGNIALLALTGQWGIAKWRGSLLTSPLGRKIIPTYPPSQLFKQFELRGIIINDLKRVKQHMQTREYTNRPQWNFRIRPTVEMILGILTELQYYVNSAPTELVIDIETHYPHGNHIECIGIAWSQTSAVCIPLSKRGNQSGWYDEDIETQIVYALYKLLTHPNARIIWQNGLFDAQVIYREWHFIPRHHLDTMITQHSCFCAMPKALDFLASMYADWYVYWKDENIEPTDDERWRYNAQDCVYTWEVAKVLRKTATSMGLNNIDGWQQSLFTPVLQTMIRGVRVRHEVKDHMAREIEEALTNRENFIQEILGHTINLRSSKQMQQLFYEDLRQKPITKRVIVNGYTKMNPTCDDEALSQIGKREPILKPLCNCIADIRTLEKFLNDFVNMPVDLDGRMRCSFNIAGDAGGKSAPYSYRLSSSKNAFGSGGNLQTIPSEKSKSAGKAAARGSMGFDLPNIRSMYGPDPGFTFFDMDLDRADLQVVVWESDDEMLKAALRLGADIHLLNTYGIDNVEPPPLDELVETHPKYADHRVPRKYKREFAKVFCHACVTAGHEVLTPIGWWPIEHLTDTQEIAVWDKGNQEIHFETPKSINRDIAETGETLISFEGQAFSQEVTADHKMPYSTTDALTFKATKAHTLPATAKLPTAGYYEGTLAVDEAVIRLIAAFQADGTFDYKYRTRWHLKKPRKIERLLWLFEQLNLSYTTSVGWNGATAFFVYWRPQAWMKVPGAWLLGLKGESLDWWLDELRYWDGYVGPTGAIHISTSDEIAAEWINTIALLRGKGSRCYVHMPAEGNRKANWHVSINNRTLAGTESMQVTRTCLTVDTPVYCPETSTGFFMVRRNGKISVTGNTNYLGRAKTVAAHTGRTVHEIDSAQKRWFAAHPGILRWHERIIQQVTKHRFVENAFGYRWYIFDRIDEQLYPAAVAWIPQSTVGIVINRAWLNFHRHIPEVQVLLQVHDSLAGQFPTHKTSTILPLMEQHSKIIIPYEDPLIIPTGIKTSLISWGDCK